MECDPGPNTKFNFLSMNAAKVLQNMPLQWKSAYNQNVSHTERALSGSHIHVHIRDLHVWESITWGGTTAVSLPVLRKLVPY